MTHLSDEKMKVADLLGKLGLVVVVVVVVELEETPLSLFFSAKQKCLTSDVRVPQTFPTLTLFSFSTSPSVPPPTTYSLSSTSTGRSSTSSSPRIEELVSQGVLHSCVTSMLMRLRRPLRGSTGEWLMVAK